MQNENLRAACETHDALIAILQAHAGKTGENEGAVDTLKRIVRERAELVSFRAGHDATAEHDKLRAELAALKAEHAKWRDAHNVACAALEYSREDVYLKRQEALQEIAKLTKERAESLQDTACTIRERDELRFANATLKTESEQLSEALRLRCEQFDAADATRAKLEAEMCELKESLQFAANCRMYAQLHEARAELAPLKETHSTLIAAYNDASAALETSRETVGRVVPERNKLDAEVREVRSELHVLKIAHDALLRERATLQAQHVYAARATGVLKDPRATRAASIERDAGGFRVNANTAADAGAKTCGDQSVFFIGAKCTLAPGHCGYHECGDTKQYRLQW